MSVDFQTVIDLAEKAYELGKREHGDARKNHRESKYDTPKRKHGPWRLFQRVRNHYKLNLVTPGHYALRLIAAAYDQGLVDRQEEIDNMHTIIGEADGTADMRTQSP
jgi:hypothetical protein